MLLRAAVVCVITAQIMLIARISVPEKLTLDASTVMIVAIIQVKEQITGSINAATLK